MQYPTLRTKSKQNEQPQKVFHIVSISQDSNEPLKAGSREHLVMTESEGHEYEVTTQTIGHTAQGQTDYNFNARDVKGYLFRASDLVTTEIVTPQKRLKIEFFSSGDMREFIRDVTGHWS